MDPVTHALSSWALARAGFERTTRLATPALIVSGVAADLDIAIFWSHPLSLLRFGGAALHSLAGSLLLIPIIAFLFWLLGTWLNAGKKKPVRFAGLLLVCFVGQAAHLLLDVCGTECVRLLWPFRENCYRLDWVAIGDVWILLLLLAGLCLPSLFALVGEEIGERKGRRGQARGAMIMLALMCAFLGARGILHTRAITLLSSRLYGGEAPHAVGAFPSQTSPLEWHGVAATSNTLFSGSVLDTERFQKHRKPEPSPWLQAAQSTAIAHEFLQRARFPLVTWEPLPDGGYLVQLQDLRHPPGGLRWFDLMTVVEMDNQYRVVREDLCPPGNCSRR
jgi:membrane-bound metal-dependent hydrolase YbcI (DUF457 family)